MTSSKAKGSGKPILAPKVTIPSKKPNVMKIAVSSSTSKKVVK